MPSGPLAFRGYEGEAPFRDRACARPVLLRVIPDASDYRIAGEEVLMAAYAAKRQPTPDDRQTRSRVSHGEQRAGGSAAASLLSQWALIPTVTTSSWS